MKIFERMIKNCRALVFLDLEGTQFSHEMIEIGAYLVTLDDDLNIKKIENGYKSYVLPHHPVGAVVTNLTGITDKQLEKEGRSAREVFLEFRKYIGKYWGKCLFVTFGSHDMRIISQSALYSADSPKTIVRGILHSDFDFSLFLSQYVKDKNGNSLSLTNYLKVFEVPFKGRAHDALTDAYNLIDLYRAVLSRPDILATEYQKTLAHLRHMPPPIVKTILSLSSGKQVSSSDWKQFIAESFE